MLPRMNRRGSTVTSFIALTVAALATATACSTTVEGDATAGDTPTTSAVPTTSTTTTTTPAPPPKVDADDYAGDQPGVYYFLSQSGKFECAILLNSAPVAGCQGEMPPNAPRVPGSGAPNVMVPANVVLVDASGPGEFVNIGDIAFMNPSRAAQSLPYGRELTVGSFTCSIDETDGVTCETEQNGFTVSDSAYDLW